MGVGQMGVGQMGVGGQVPICRDEVYGVFSVEMLSGEGVSVCVCVCLIAYTSLSAEWIFM